MSFEAPAVTLPEVPVVARQMWRQDSNLEVVPEHSLTPAERATHARQVAQMSVHFDGCVALVQGEVLFETATQRWYDQWGFGSFDEYIEEELDFKRRKAYYLMAVYDKFVRELGLDVDVLKGLQWSKAKCLLSVINVENCNELLDKIRKMSVRQVEAMVKDMKGNGSGGDDDGLNKSFKAKLSEPQYENVISALSLAGDASHSESVGHNLDLICTSYLTDAIIECASDIEADKVEAMLANQLGRIEQTFGIRLQIVETPGNDA